MNYLAFARVQVNQCIQQLIGPRDYGVRRQRSGLSSDYLGHVIAADNWINLKDAMDRQLLQPADKFMMFNFGFGANWAATVMEH